MELSHEFTVPGSVEETWQAFNDIESVAGCFPGAVVSSVEGDTFTGSCKVRLGPIALVYNGTGTFLEKDESAHSLMLEAKGKDKRGNGTAGALVTATMTDDGSGTRVKVLTDLNITGKPAQFGRGMISDVSDKLLGQFVDCLATRVSAPDEAAAEAEPSGSPGPPGSLGPPPLAGEAEAAAQDPGPVPRSTPPGSEDALDLGATVLPVMVKLYWKQLAAAFGVLVVLAWLVRRRG